MEDAHNGVAGRNAPSSPLQPLCVAAALVIAVTGAHAHAGMLEVKIGETLVGDLCVVDVYVTVPHAGGHIISVFNASVSMGGGFDTLVHNDSLGGTWLPQYATDGAIDTFITVGGEPVPSNDTSIDPTWMPEGATQPGISDGAGWFNSNPTSFQGAPSPVDLHTLDGRETYVGFATHVARFVFAQDPGGRSLSLAGGVAWQVAHAPTVFDSIEYAGVVGNVPGPAGAAAFVVGLASRPCRGRDRHSHARATA
ncbi:MAG: hypothetical protein JNM94_13200 [Phycisphaerae bacterium]|nr:hypothetical protein [Phycisphaerae bacterium]